MRLALVERVAGKNDLDVFAAEHTHLVYLLLGRYSRHIDHAVYTQVTA